MVLVSPPSFSRPPRALAMLMPGNDGGDGLTPSFLMARPQSPAHQEPSYCNTGGCTTRVIHVPHTGSHHVTSLAPHTASLRYA